MTNEALVSMPAKLVPALIRAEHKTKYAIIYVRQSTMDQVRNNTGSTESQRSLATLPREWGWPPELILVIDEDLGLSGTNSTQRTGLQRIEAMLDRREVGLLIMRDSARLSRDPAIAERFLKKAIRAGILLEQNGKLLDLPRSRPVELLGVHLGHVFDWWDNEQRKHTFQVARTEEIRQGKAVSRPPMGYLPSRKGYWIKDTDPAVREVIRQVFNVYLQRWSTRKTARHLNKAGLAYPKRRHGRIEWEPLTNMHVNAS